MDDAAAGSYAGHLALLGAVIIIPVAGRSQASVAVFCPFSDFP